MIGWRATCQQLCRNEVRPRMLLLWGEDGDVNKGGNRGGVVGSLKIMSGKFKICIAPSPSHMTVCKHVHDLYLDAFDTVSGIKSRQYSWIFYEN